MAAAPRSEPEACAGLESKSSEQTKLEANSKGLKDPRSLKSLKDLDWPTLFPVHVNFPVQEDPSKHKTNFVDIMPWAAHGDAYNQVLREIADMFKYIHVDQIVIPEARAWLLAPLALMLNNADVVVVRKATKPSKIPGPVVGSSFECEYAKRDIELQRGLIKAGARVALVDDVLATGNTLASCLDLVKSEGAQVIAVTALVEVEGLGGRHLLEEAGVNVYGPLLTLPSTDAPGAAIHAIDADDTPPTVRRRVPLTPVTYPKLTNDWVGFPDDVIDSRLLVLYHPSMELLANRLCDAFPHHLERGVIRWGKFGDVTPDLNIFPQQMRHRHVIFLMNTRFPELMEEQLDVVMVLPRQACVESVTVCIPFVSTATNERVNVQGEVASAEPWAKRLSNLTSTVKAKTRVMVFDIHALAEQFYFTDQVMYMPLSAMAALWAEMDAMAGKDGWVVIFPDDGAEKRFASLVPDGVPVAAGIKKRKSERREIVGFSTSQNWPGNDQWGTKVAVVVDDLVQSGSTLLEAIKVAKTNWPIQHFYTFATHAVFPRKSYLNLLKDPNVKRCMVADTIPDMGELLENLDAKFKVISIAPTLSRALIYLHRMSHPISIPSSLLWHHKKFLVASTSPHKIAAVEYAMSRSMQVQARMSVSRRQVAPRVIPVDGCLSGVAKQPIGMGEILKGASSRLAHAASLAHAAFTHTEASCDYEAVVSIESGLVRDHSTGASGKCYDIAAVLICHPRHTHAYCHLEWTKPVALPEPMVIEELKSREDPDMTMGDMMVKAGRATSSTDWHRDVAGIHRSHLMGEAVIKALDVYYPLATLGAAYSDPQFFQIVRQSGQLPKFGLDCTRLLD